MRRRWSVEGVSPGPLWWTSNLLGSSFLPPNLLPPVIGHTPEGRDRGSCPVRGGDLGGDPSPLLPEDTTGSSWGSPHRPSPDSAEKKVDPF